MAVYPLSDWAYALIQFIMVLSVWSYLYKDNIMSRISAQIVISISTVHYFLSYLIATYQRAVIPIATKGQFTLIIPIILGFLIYFRLSKKYSWVSAYSYSVQLGLGTGAVLTTLVAGSITLLIVDTVKTPFSKQFDPISGSLVVIGVVTALCYWLFTKEFKGALGYVVKVGRLFLMASIGLLYAQDVLWSQSLFVGAMEMALKFIYMLLGRV